MSGVADSCALCGSDDLTLLLDMGSQPLSERHDSDDWYPLMVVRCEACGLVQAGYIVDPKEMFPPGHPYASGNTAALIRHFAQLTAEIENLLEPGDLVVDIGANDGTLLASYDMQLTRVGVEPTSQALKAMARGAIVYQDFFSAGLAQSVLADNGPAKVVTATNVMAHVPDPHDFLEGVKRLLSDDGVFVTENHDVASLLDGLQFDTVYHEHLRFYSVATLSRLLAMHGLAVYRTEPVPTHGGSFRVWACRERTDLQARADRAAEELRRLLQYASHLGHIYGVSATTRATPLIHFARIEKYIECVCEMPQSEKIGQFIPGTDIPVVDERQLIEDQPAFAVLFAWHIKDDLMASLRRKGYKGRFIVPLPEPEILAYV